MCTKNLTTITNDRQQTQVARAKQYVYSLPHRAVCSLSPTPNNLRSILSTQVTVCSSLPTMARSKLMLFGCPTLIYNPIPTAQGIKGLATTKAQQRFK